jgi:hypothetical protein
MKKFEPITTDRLCKHCKHAGHRKTGLLSYTYFCKIHKGNFNKGTGLGIDICNTKPHLKCPLRTGDLSDVARRSIRRGIPM